MVEKVEQQAQILQVLLQNHLQTNQLTSTVELSLQDPRLQNHLQTNQLTSTVELSLQDPRLQKLRKEN
jgi:hypothetical protein